jgi:hypothetical protein
VQDELAFRSACLPALPKADGKPYDFTGKSRDAVRADAVGPAVMAEAAKLGERCRARGLHPGAREDEARRRGQDAAGAAHPDVVVEDSDQAEAQKPDKRADAFNASWGTPAAGASK